MVTTANTGKWALSWPYYMYPSCAYNGGRLGAYCVFVFDALWLFGALTTGLAESMRPFTATKVLFLARCKLQYWTAYHSKSVTGMVGKLSRMSYHNFRGLLRSHRF